MGNQLHVKFTEEDLAALKEALADMDNPVDLYLFIGSECLYCDDAVKVVKALTQVAPEKPSTGKLLRVKVCFKERDEECFSKMRVERIPTIALIEGYVRWTGTPAGEELKALVETIIRISNGDSGLEEYTRRVIRERIVRPVKIETIVTPLCPYCPYAALLTHMFAFESWLSGRRLILSDVIEAYENMDIAYKYNVMTVPTIAINGNVEFVGVPYEDELLRRIIQRAGESRIRFM